MKYLKGHTQIFLRKSTYFQTNQTQNQKNKQKSLKQPNFNNTKMIQQKQSHNFNNLNKKDVIMQQKKQYILIKRLFRRNVLIFCKNLKKSIKFMKGSNKNLQICHLLSNNLIMKYNIYTNKQKQLRQKTKTQINSQKVLRNKKQKIINKEITNCHQCQNYYKKIQICFKLLRLNLQKMKSSYKKCKQEHKNGNKIHSNAQKIKYNIQNNSQTVQYSSKVLYRKYFKYMTLCNTLRIRKSSVQYKHYSVSPIQNNNYITYYSRTLENDKYINVYTKLQIIIQSNINIRITLIASQKTTKTMQIQHPIPQMRSLLPIQALTPIYSVSQRPWYKVYRAQCMIPLATYSLKLVYIFTFIGFKIYVRVELYLVPMVCPPAFSIQYPEELMNMPSIQPNPKPIPLGCILFNCMFCGRSGLGVSCKCYVPGKGQSKKNQTMNQENNEKIGENYNNKMEEEQIKQKEEQKMQE